MLGGGKGRAAFCHSAAVIDKDKRKGTDWSEYPLTTHGELLLALAQSGLSGFPHRAVSLQFFETISRYTDFFKVRKETIVPTLEAFVDARCVYLISVTPTYLNSNDYSGLHHPDSSFRARLSFLFSRFIRESRNDIPQNICETITQSVRDLLEIEVQLPDPEEVETDILTEAAKNPRFETQLFLFETIGILCAIIAKDSSEPTRLLLSFVTPLMDKLSESLQAYGKGGQDVVPVVLTHHIIYALGTIAKGYPDYPTPAHADYVSPSLDVFAQVAQAILVCLERMNVFKIVREAVSLFHYISMHYVE